jgi:hypothetical protein
MPCAHEMNWKRKPCTARQNRDNHSRPGNVDKVASELAAELQPLISGIQERLKQFTYPFSCARQVDGRRYAHFEKPAEFELQRVFQDGNTCGAFVRLHYRLIGRSSPTPPHGKRSSKQ